MYININKCIYCTTNSIWYIFVKQSDNIYWVRLVTIFLVKAIELACFYEIPRASSFSYECNAILYINHIEGKITQIWLANDQGIFS